MNRNLAVGVGLGIVAVTVTAIFLLMPRDISKGSKASPRAGEFAEEVRSAEEEMLRRQAIQAIREMLQKKDLKRAYEMANDLLKRDPKEPYGYYVTGLIELAGGEYLRGRRKLLDAIDLGLETKDQATAYYNLGVMESKRENTEKAMGYMQLAIQTDPNDLKAQSALEELTQRS